jgi:hypothetical protein
MQVRVSGRRRPLDEFLELSFNAKVLTSVRDGESLDSAARWRAERHKINAQIAALPSVVQKMHPRQIDEGTL